MPRAFRITLGLGAIALLGGLALCLPGWRSSSYPAVVKAARVLELAASSPGRYQLTIRNGQPPVGRALVEQRLLIFERSELVEVALAPGLTTGETVAAGCLLATVRSTMVVHRQAELEARREVLEAERRLLVAGARPEEVEQAKKRVELAQARHRAQGAELDRTQLLAEQGLVSAADLEISELDDTVHQLQVELARQGVDVARSSARPEALAAIDSEIGAIDASLAEVRSRHQEEAVVAPFAGIVELGGDGVELRLLEVDAVYLSFLVPADQCPDITSGDDLVFVSRAGGETLSGRIHAVADAVTVLDGRPFCWVSGRLSNPQHRLRDGMLGIVEIGRPDPTQRSLLARLATTFWERQS